MKNSILLALFGTAVIAAVPAYAITANFDFTTGSGAQYTNGGTNGDLGPYSVTATGSLNPLNGVTVTAYAFGNTGTSGKLQQATLGQYTSYGLGVCNQDESSLGS